MYQMCSESCSVIPCFTEEV
ncbi:hypothetical protein DWV44_12175 [Lachnospira eligens]|uniref:Uncharacterized protein n=1 Tax=Lachnospira eligens TaxID=39485 RepID=A0A415PDV3_9FIRM|nr:hypothetical protein DWY02_07255 [Eubacterium sp. AF22-9]RGT50258.1 hypothetical protein DWX21_13205 [Lachnospira eligens]RGW87206.1 hypothetical protein DWV44_12175 [Lachnospira eligens]RHA47153.1 hypothetical protein DW933_10195 [Lachnospira eligens]RHC11588.1 hypothetical protein DW858_13020 [Lachnospira eligens]